MKISELYKSCCCFGNTKNLLFTFSFVANIKISTRECTWNFIQQNELQNTENEITYCIYSIVHKQVVS